MDVLSRIVAAVVSVIVLIASFFVGAVVALVALGLVVIGWLAFAVRWWQLKRQQRNAAADRPDTIEGEYRVVHKQDDDR